jgi:IS30 family transposase
MRVIITEDGRRYPEHQLTSEQREKRRHIFHDLRAHGHSVRAISKLTGWGKSTVHREIRTGEK